MDYKKLIIDEAKRQGVTVSKLSLKMDVPKGLIFRFLYKPNAKLNHINFLKMAKACGYQMRNVRRKKKD